MGDIRHAFRVLIRHPAFSAAVIGILALGIGANTAVFSLLYGILLRPFPYHDPDRLVAVQSQYTKTSGNIRGSSLPDIDDWSDRNRSFSDISAYMAFDTDLLSDGPSKPLRMAWVTPSALHSLGVGALAGRLFRLEEDRPGGDADVAIISHRLWESEFGRDDGIISRTVRTAMGHFRIVGVMPAGFLFPDRTDLWAPVQSGYNRGGIRRDQYRGSRPYSALGRLKPGVTLEQARADLTAIAAQLESAYPNENVGVRPVLTPLRDAEVGAIRPYLLLLLGAVGCVLLICCANAANLLLAKSVRRSREFAIRAAMGAGAGRLLRQLLAESLLLSLVAAVLGLGLAYAGLRLLPALIPVTLPFWMRIEIDASVLAFNVAAAVITGLIFGIAPGWTLSRAGFGQSLGAAARGSTGSGAVARVRDGLVVAEVAIALALLVGAGLLLKTFLRLQDVEIGFRPGGVLTARVSPFRPGTVSQKIDAYSSYYRRVLNEIETLPGVEAAGGAGDLPFSGSRGERFAGDVTIRGQSEREAHQSAPTTQFNVSPGYFHAMGIPLLKGRDFSQADDQKSPPVVIISARTAELLWPGQEPLGRQLRWGRVDVDTQWPWHTVVGVVGNVKAYATDPERTMELYYSYRQRSTGAFSFVVRTTGRPESLHRALRAAIQRVDKDTSIIWIKTLQDVVTESMWQRRLWSALFSLFAALALLLAAAGMYGVMSYLVGQQTREIGIRMALGAAPSKVLAMVLRRAMLLVGAGAALGLMASLALARGIRSLLFGVAPYDPAVLAVVVALMVAVALAACYVPGRRAATVDPVIALRDE